MRDNAVNIRKMNIRTLLAQAAFLSLLIYVLSTGMSDISLCSYTSSEADAAINVLRAVQEIVYSETEGTSASQEVISGKSVPQKLIGGRNYAEPLASVPFFLRTGICRLLQSYSCKTIVSSHRFIILYIHDLDGRKS